MEFETTRFANGWTKDDVWMFERVFARIRLEETIPDTRFEAFRYERPAPFPEYRFAVTLLRFEVPRTLSVDAPYTTAELTVK